VFLASATTSNVTTVTAATGNATSFTYDALVTAYYSLPYQYRQNAAWVVSDSAEKNLRLLKDGQNNPLWQPNMVEGNPPTMFGRPVYNSPDLPTAAANNISVLAHG
jgi:HK97 family phage major capsid protein